MKEISQFEMLLLEKMLKGNKDGLPIKTYLESKEFKDSIMSLLEFEKINGKDCITNDSKNKVRNIDSVDLIEKFTGNTIDSSNVGGTLMVLMVKRVLMDIVAENTNDIPNTYNVDYKHYLNLFKSYGFDNVLEIKYNKTIKDEFSDETGFEEYIENTNGRIISKNEKNGKIYLEYEKEQVEFFLFNRERGLLIHGETIGQNINSVDLIANVEFKQGMRLENYSGGTIHGTHKKNITIDLRELPSSKLDELYSKTIPVKEFLQFDYNFYSYLTHKDVEVGAVDWNEIKAEKISKLPKDIVEQLLSKNINHQLLKEVNSYFEDSQKINEKNKEEKDFMFNLPENFQKEISLRYEVFGGSKISYLSDELIDYIKKTNSNLDTNVCADYCSYALKSQRDRKLEFQYCVDMFSKFKKEELEHCKNNIKYLLIKREESNNLINYVDARLEFLSQPSNQKGSKIKLN